MKIPRVSDQNGVSLLYIMLEIHHSVWEFSIWIQPFQAATGTHKGGHSLQNYTGRGRVGELCDGWSPLCVGGGTCSGYRLVGLLVRRPPRERKIPGSNPACAGIFSGSSHTSDLKTGTPVATLPGAWCYRVSTGTGRPGVSIL